jgi:hypothetical protein
VRKKGSDSLNDPLDEEDEELEDKILSAKFDQKMRKRAKGKKKVALSERQSFKVGFLGLTVTSEEMEGT